MILLTEVSFAAPLLLGRSLFTLLHNFDISSSHDDQIKLKRDIHVSASMNQMRYLGEDRLLL